MSLFKVETSINYKYICTILDITDNIHDITVLPMDNTSERTIKMTKDNIKDPWTILTIIYIYIYIDTTSTNLIKVQKMLWCIKKKKENRILNRGLK